MLRAKLQGLPNPEHEKGVLDVSADCLSSILAHDAGYRDRNSGLIVGLQTDFPLKRAITPNGGLRMVAPGLDAYGYKMGPGVAEVWKTYRKCRNQAVFDVYSPDVVKARKSGIVTGLPDAYARGRIIGDYRRVDPYGWISCARTSSASCVRLAARPALCRGDTHG